MWPFKKKTKQLKLNNGEIIEIHHTFLRDDTTLPMQEINFIFNFGGLGDYIHWMTAIQWIFETHTHLHGSLIVPGYFYDLASHWMKNPRVIVRQYSKIEDDDFIKREDQLFIMPNSQQMISACGFHLLNLGFHFFANTDEIPDGYMKIPKINGDETDIKRFNLPVNNNYAVITTEATSPIRKLKAETINGMTEWCRFNNIVPVFLGKKELHHDYKAAAAEGIELGGVFDLREKTNLLEAACILANAKFVAGLDNGLLHLACCSKVPVIFGFNTVHPRHRVPPRDFGARTIAVVPNENLKCRFCQSNIKFVLGHNFHKCLYGDNLCLDNLSAKSFTHAIEKLEGVTDETRTEQRDEEAAAEI